MRLYVGGMVHRSKNFRNAIMVRRGFGDAASRIQELYLAGRKDVPTATVPGEWVGMKSLVGPSALSRVEGLRCRIPSTDVARTCSDTLAQTLLA
jgi:hypothetical protein